MRLIAFETDSRSITRILAYLGEPTEAPHIAPTACGLAWEEDFDTREGDTCALSERAASESQGEGVSLLGARRTQRALPANPGMDASHW